MSKLPVHSFSISIDGYGAGPDQDLENPLGVGWLKVFSHTLFGVYVGVMVWAGLWLRDPRLRGLLTLVEMRRRRGRPERPVSPLNI